MQRTPYTQKDFDWVNWTPQNIRELVLFLVSEKKNRLNRIANISEKERSFENTVYALAAHDNDLSDTILKIDLLMNVSPNETVRKAAEQAINTIQKKFIDLDHDARIYRALTSYRANAYKTEKRSLAPDEQKLFEDFSRVYARMGFGLPLEKQKKLALIKKRIAELSVAFRQNINKHEDHIVVTDTDLAGLPADYCAGLSTTKDGKKKVTLAYPDMNPFMKLSPNEPKRKELYEKNVQKGGEKNMRVLHELVTLRHEHARLLGYKNHADYQTELRMAKTGAKALAFEETLLKKIIKAGKKDLADIQTLKRSRTGNKKAVIHPHDIAYYAHELEKERFHTDSEAVRAHYPLPHVLSGVFAIYQKLLGVTFEEAPIHLWHPDAKLYAIKEKGKILAYFAIDLHPRAGKYGHAAAFGIIAGRETSFRGNEYQPPLAAMVANFTKPTPNHPSLLTHEEVETFLHELGHIMHYTLTTVRFAPSSGYHVAWDFVEAPSQMFEHWAWDERSLRLISAHYETGAPLPKNLLKNLIASKRHFVGYETLRQLNLGIFDLKLHSGKKVANAATFYNSILKKNTGLVMPKGAIFPAGFGHLDGYDAGYYSYLWAKVYAVDMFTRFGKEGILNKKTGTAYRKAILERGASRDELVSVKDFLGRAPSNAAFLKEIGIK